MFLTSIKYNYIALISFLILFTLKVNAQQTLSSNAEISILTCAKGNDLYNTFGHSGIRVKDANNKIDIVFNYGMFSFGGSTWQDQLDFGLNFIQGKLNYWLGVQEFNNFVYSYKKQERWVYEQVLNLSQDEKQHLFNALVINYEPENRNYKYDFFFDNCSSRVRDILEDAVGPVFGDENSPIHEKTEYSHIDLIDPYICGSPWLDFGMDIILGIPSSEKTSRYEFMFLPYHLKEQISLADGLVKKEGILIPFPDNPIGIRSFHLFAPINVFIVLLLLITYISYKNYQANKHWFWIDRIILFTTGIAGLLFLFMWLGTDHVPTYANLNMFWAFPLNIFAVFLVKNKKWASYFKIILGLASFILLAWFLSPQQYHYAIIPLSLILIIRYFKILDWHNKTK